MSETSAPQVTLGDALREYLNGLKPEQRNTQGVYVRKYVEHAGELFRCSDLTGARVESYAEARIRSSDPNAQERVAALKAWFQFLRKRTYTTQNFGINVRVRKASSRGSGSQRVIAAPESIEMTAEGLQALKRESEILIQQVPDLVRAVALAREDKDFRENAPLEAAREALAFNEQRRKQIESTLKRAVVVERAALDDTAVVGSTVVVVRLDNSVNSTYKLVGAREANAAEQKISVESPVGRQLLGKRAGDEVTVAAPSGVIQLRIESIAHGK